MAAMSNVEYRDLPGRAVALETGQAQAMAGKQATTTPDTTSASMGDRDRAGQARSANTERYEPMPRDSARHPPMPASRAVQGTWPAGWL